jgi:hypothetical protein
VHVPLHGATHPRIVHEEEVHDFQGALNLPPANMVLQRSIILPRFARADARR